MLYYFSRVFKFVTVYNIYIEDRNENYILPKVYEWKFAK